MSFTNTNTTMTKHYYKGLAANGITVANKRVPFIVLTNGDGIIQTDNPDIQAALDLRIEERRGGVRSPPPCTASAGPVRRRAARRACNLTARRWRAQTRGTTS